MAFFYQSTNSDLEDVIAHSIIFGICFNSENMQLIMENFWVSANGLIENVWLPLSQTSASETPCLGYQVYALGLGYSCLVNRGNRTKIN